MESPREMEPLNASASYAEPAPGAAPPDPALARFEQIVADVSRRLAKACGHLSEAEFETLVRDISRVKVRFDEVDAAHWRPLIDHMTANGSVRVSAARGGQAT